MTKETVGKETATRTSLPVAVDPHATPAPTESEGEVENETPPEVPGAPIASPTLISQGALPAASSAAVKRRSLTATAEAFDEQLAGNLQCAVSGRLGGFTGSSCGAAWLGSQMLLSSSPGELADVAVGSEATTTADAPDVGDHGGATADYHPAGQAPGPGPGGASGGSAVGGSAGCSSCLTLAGLLRLGGPRAMRRLRLSCEPWLTACFVLIPERPG